jgi:hypothetical protein
MKLRVYHVPMDYKNLISYFVIAAIQLCIFSYCNQSFCSLHSGTY